MSAWIWVLPRSCPVESSFSQEIPPQANTCRFTPTEAAIWYTGHVDFGSVVRSDRRPLSSSVRSHLFVLFCFADTCTAYRDSQFERWSVAAKTLPSCLSGQRKVLARPKMTVLRGHDWKIENSHFEQNFAQSQKIPRSVMLNLVVFLNSELSWSVLFEHHTTFMKRNFGATLS